MNAPLGITLFSCAVLGFRHGFDYDHIAAITDIASVQSRPAIAMRLGALYALGHAAMIALMGTIVICFQLSLPHRLDSWAERLVGLTLILLAIYVIGSLVWGHPHAVPPSRAAIILRAARQLRNGLFARDTGTRINLSSKDDLTYTGQIAFGIGTIHGLGAETPSQLALFLLATNLGGPARGIAGMSMFLAGLLVMNTLMTASASGLFQGTAPHPKALRWIAGMTAIYSFAVGCVFILGASGILPALG